MSGFNPLVSVVMPVYNMAPWVEPAVHSILRQSYANLELIVVNDSSTDETCEIVRSVKDSRIRIVDADHSGYVKALAAGIHEAKGEWIARMDGDDISHPERLQRTLDFVEEHPNCVIVGTAHGYLTPNGTLLQRKKVNFEWRQLTRSLLTWGRICYEPSMIFHRKAAIEVGLYDLDFPWKEVTLWYRLLSRGIGYEISSCCGTFYRYYRGGANTSQYANRVQTAKLRQRYDPDGYRAHYRLFYQRFPDRRSVDEVKFLRVIRQCRAAKDWVSMMGYARKAFRISNPYQSGRRILGALTGLRSLRFWKWPREFNRSEFEIFVAENPDVSSVLAEMGLKFRQTRVDSFSLSLQKRLAEDMRSVLKRERGASPEN